MTTRVPTWRKYRQRHGWSNYGKPRSGARGVKTRWNDERRLAMSNMLMIRYPCRTCDTVLESPKKHAGLSLACPICNALMKVPKHNKTTRDPSVNMEFSLPGGTELKSEV